MAMPKLTPEFREFLRLLHLAGVEYLLIGGYAVGCHGYVRYTDDIDFWVATSAANLTRIRDVLVQFGFRPQDLPEPFFTPSVQVLRIGRRPNKLELFSTIPGVDFDACYARRQTVLLDEGIPIQIISYEDLVAAKIAAGRPKDVADVDELRRSRVCKDRS